MLLGYRAVFDVIIFSSSLERIASPLSSGTPARACHAYYTMCNSHGYVFQCIQDNVVLSLLEEDSELRLHYKKWDLVERWQYLTEVHKWSVIDDEASDEAAIASPDNEAVLSRDKVRYRFFIARWLVAEQSLVCKCNSNQKLARLTHKTLGMCDAGCRSTVRGPSYALRAPRLFIFGCCPCFDAPLL